MRSVPAEPDFYVESPPAESGGRTRKRRFAPMKRCGLAVAFGLVALALAGVPLNALYFQEGRHPAPLFHRFPAPSTADSSPRNLAEERPPLPPPRPAAAVAEQAPAPKAESARQNEKRRDAIAALIEHGSVKADDPDVMLAQKALIKLGYSIEADGVMGAATRQAIAKFERDNGLKGRGELTSELMRELLARAGLR